MAEGMRMSLAPTDLGDFQEWEHPGLFEMGLWGSVLPPSTCPAGPLAWELQEDRVLSPTFWVLHLLHPLGTRLAFAWWAGGQRCPRHPFGQSRRSAAPSWLGRSMGWGLQDYFMHWKP